MLKKCLIVIVSVLALSFAIVGIGGQFSNDDSSKFSNVNETRDNRNASKNLIGVEFTLPAEYLGDTTQEELDDLVKELGFVSITLNEDGSATFVMLSSRQRALVDEMRDEIRTKLEEMIGSEKCPYVTATEINFDFNEILITTSSKELADNEIAVVAELAEDIQLYNYVSGEGITNLRVVFTNADSNKTMDTFDTEIKSMN